MSARPENALDHVVVVMFENRSFDNLLGRLYEPGEVASFEGVTGKNLSNPVPEWAEHRPDNGIVPYGVPANMNTPNPDPGEELPNLYIGGRAKASGLNQSLGLGFARRGSPTMSGLAFVPLPSVAPGTCGVSGAPAVKR